MTSKSLITASKLGDAFSMPYVDVVAALSEAKLEPVYVVGKQRMFEEEAARKVVSDAKQARRERHGNARPAIDTSLLQQVIDGQAMLSARLDDLEESLAASFKLMTEQHATLLRAVEALRPAPAAAAKTAPVVADAPTQAAQVVPIRRITIGIVGLNQAQFAEVRREFGAEFELRHWEASEARSASFRTGIAGVDHLVVMVRFAGHEAITTIKAQRVPFTSVSGGMSTLKTELTRIFLQPKAAA